MEKTVYYVAVGGSDGMFNPTIVERFDKKSDADIYAALMSRTKQRRYVVLEQIMEWTGAAQEN